MVTVAKSHPALDAYYAHLKENGFDYGKGDPRGRHKVAEISGHAIWRFTDGWGEFYFITQNGRARWLAQKMPDVLAYAVSAPLKATINKPWIREHGWGDVAWETAMTQWLEGATKSLTTGDFPAGALTVEETRPRRRYPWEQGLAKSHSEADIRAINEDLEQINRNRETAAAKRAHAFTPAQWTFLNGHPRCLLCGHGEYDGGCMGVDKEDHLPPALKPVTKAAGAGLVVVLAPPPSIARLLAIQGGEPRDDLHLTLAYVGDLEDITDDQRGALEREIRLLAEARSPLKGEISGYGRFNGTDSDGDQAFYASVDMPDLPRLREEVVRAGERAGLEVSKHHGFTPHITLAYVGPEVEDPPRRAGTIPITFNALQVWAGTEHRRMPFGMRKEESVPRAVHSTIGFLKQVEELRYTLGVMYKGTVDETDPETDAHEDYAPLELLQRAQWAYVRSGDRNIYLQHGLTDDGMQVIGEWVGVLTWPYESEVILTIPGVGSRKVLLPEGTVLMEVIWNEIGWAMVKDGRIRGLSMGGRYRTEVVGPDGKPALPVAKAAASPQQRRVMERFRSDAERLGQTMADEMEDAFQELGVLVERAYRRIQSKAAPVGEETAFVAQDDTVDEVMEELGIGYEQALLLPLLASHLRRTTTATVESINQAMALNVSLPDARMRAIIENASQRLAMQDITGVTRAALHSALADAQAAGEGLVLTTRRIREYVPAGRYTKEGVEYRARLIARTETRYAQNLAAVEGYRESGTVKGLMAFDNQTGHDDADCTARDGQVYNFEAAARETDLEHPNGTLAWAPEE